MDADGFSVVDNRAGVTLGVELYVPCDAPEAVVDAVPLRSVPDVYGVVGRCDSATESRVLLGRDACCVRVLVPDCRGLDQTFHDVTVVDMGDFPESNVSMPELSKLIHIMWRQRELEEMRRVANVKYRQKHLSPCTFCGTLIRCDMYRHMARCHLELAQLWRCPVSWCTVWKGAPQDLMDCSAISGCRWSTTTGCTRGAFPMSHFGETICRSCALFCLCLWFCQLKGDRPTLHARLCHVWWSLQMLYVPRLDRPDVRLVAGGQLGSWSHLNESVQDPLAAAGRWCSIATLHCCRG